MSRYHEVSMEENLDAGDDNSFERRGTMRASNARTETTREHRSTTSRSSLQREADELELSLNINNSEEHNSNAAGSLVWEAPSQSNVPLAPVLSEAYDDDESLTTMDTGTSSKKKVSLAMLIANQDGPRVMRRIQHHPKSFQHRRTFQLQNRMTRAHPLHYAVSLNPPVYLVDAMIEVYPEACRLPDKIFGQLPLHIACNFRADTDVLKSLLDTFPEAVRLTDYGKRLPLHYACHDGEPNNVSLLLSVDTSGLAAQDINGMTPVDMCRASQSPYRKKILKQIRRVSEGDDGRDGGGKASRAVLAEGTHANSAVPIDQDDLESSTHGKRGYSPNAADTKEAKRDASSSAWNARNVDPEGRTFMHSESLPSDTNESMTEKKKKRSKSFSGTFKKLHLTHRQKKQSEDDELDQSTSFDRLSQSIQSLPFFNRKEKSDINDDSMSSLNSRFSDSLSSFQNSFQRPQLEVRPPRKNDEMESALIPWLAAGATIEAPTRGTALSIRRPQAQSVDQNNSARPAYSRKNTSDSEPSAPYSQPDAIDIELVQDGYKGYKEYTKPDEDNSMKKEHLRRRKAALLKELDQAQGNIQMKKEKIEQCQKKIDDYGAKIQEILVAIDKERVSMDFAKSAIRSNEEIAAQHEEHIKEVDEELAKIGEDPSAMYGDPLDDSLDLSDVFD